MSIIDGKKLSGVVLVPPSKSMSHRAIICAALSKGKSIIHNVSYSEDILATIDGVKSLGVDVKILKKEKDSISLIIEGNVNNKDSIVFSARESGTTMRLLIPILACYDKEVTIKGEGRLMKRPHYIYEKIFNERNLLFFQNEECLKFKGPLKPGKYRVDGSISSQFISGLLFALPLLDGDSEIEILGKFESKSYVDLTLQIQKEFGIKIKFIDNKYYIKGNQKYRNRDYTVENDCSQGAFWLSLCALGADIKVKGFPIKSLQGDRVILTLLEKMGADFLIKEDIILCKKTANRSIKVDVSNCPDLVPILSGVMCFLEGEGQITNAKRLRLKESDRLSSMKNNLNKIGANIVELEDSLIIKGINNFSHGIINSDNDHRIAMTFGILSYKVGKLEIDDISVVKKSYPRFWNVFCELGGFVDGLNMA